MAKSGVGRSHKDVYCCVSREGLARRIALEWSEPDLSGGVKGVLDRLGEMPLVSHFVKR